MDNLLEELHPIFRDVLDLPNLIITRESNASTVEDWDSLVVNLSLIFFRSSTMHHAALMMVSLANPHHVFGIQTLREAWSLMAGRELAALLVGTVIAFHGKSSDQLAREFKPKWWNSIAVATMIVLSWLSLIFNTQQEFVYFKF